MNMLMINIYNATLKFKLVHELYGQPSYIRLLTFHTLKRENIPCLIPYMVYKPSELEIATLKNIKTPDFSTLYAVITYAKLKTKDFECCVFYKNKRRMIYLVSQNSHG
jgi:hypothetical protein